jgi:hypothetical protein
VRAGLNVGLDASGPVAVNIARHCLRLALGDCVVRSCESDPIKIGKAFEDRAHREVQERRRFDPAVAAIAWIVSAMLCLTLELEIVV